MVISLQITTTFQIGGRPNFLSYFIHNITDDRQIEMHTAEPLVTGLSS
jgi:hypothetical protein